MELTKIERSWTFTHHFPGEAEPRTWTLEEPTIDGVELPYMRHLEAQQKAGLERNYKPNEPGYRVMAEVFLAGFSNGSYKWGGRKFGDTFSDDENLRTVVLLWFRQAEAKAKPKDAITPALVNAMWKTRRVDLDALVAEMLSDPLASSPQTAGGLTTPSSSPSSLIEPTGPASK